MIRRWLPVAAAALALGGCETRSLVSLPLPDAGCGIGRVECNEACVALQSDAQNCGACGAACRPEEACLEGVCRGAECTVAADCPAPAHAAARCEEGFCRRGPCEPGTFDFDGKVTPGCEASCIERFCAFGDGGQLTVTNEPLPEQGAIFQVLSSGGSFGAQVQTSPEFTNLGVLGEPTPPATDGVAEQSSPEFRNVGGFGSIQGR